MKNMAKFSLPKKVLTGKGFIYLGTIVSLLFGGFVLLYLLLRPAPSIQNSANLAKSAIIPITGEVGEVIPTSKFFFLVGKIEQMETFSRYNSAGTAYHYTVLDVSLILPKTSPVSYRDFFNALENARLIDQSGDLYPTQEVGRYPNSAYLPEVTRLHVWLAFRTPKLASQLIFQYELKSEIIEETVLVSVVKPDPRVGRISLRLLKD